MPFEQLLKDHEPTIQMWYIYSHPMIDSFPWYDYRGLLQLRCAVAGKLVFHVGGEVTVEGKLVVGVTSVVHYVCTRKHTADLAQHLHCQLPIRVSFNGIFQSFERYTEVVPRPPQEAQAEVN